MKDVQLLGDKIQVKTTAGEYWKRNEAEVISLSFKNLSQ